MSPKTVVIERAVEQFLDNNSTDKDGFHNG